MDWKKVCEDFRLAFTVVIAVALLWASPVAAQDWAPPNDAVHVNSENVIMSGELPAPLPSLPGRLDMPDLVLPEIDPSNWPDIVTGREAAETAINSRLLDVRASLNEQYGRVRTTVDSVRSTTNALRDFVGNPATSVTAQSDTRSLTVTSMAQEMAQSVNSSMSYLRGVSNLGPLGLDLVFVFIGLGWILFMNFVELLLSVIGFILKVVVGGFKLILSILGFYLSLARTIIEAIPFW